jgi:hypothetical protein
MDSILRDNVRYGKNSLLRFSVKKDLKSLTRRIAYRGGDVNTTAGYSRRSAVLPSPLSIAAYYGYEDMVKLLLELGAQPSGQGKDIPLAVAVSKRHKRVALILLQSPDSINGDSGMTEGKLLQIASAAKMVTLVSHLLERRSELHTRDVDTALYHVLLGDTSKENILKRAFHHEVYQIVLMLLQNGASPDVRPRGKVMPKLTTARLLSSRHPDPRVRALLLDTVNPSRPGEFRKSDSRVGRSWVVPSEVENAEPENSGPTDSYANQVLFAKLGDFLEKPRDEKPLAIEGQDVTNDWSAHNEEMHDIRYTSTILDIETFLENTRQLKTSEGSVTVETFPGDAFPQLGTPIETAQQAVRGIWTSANPSIHLPYSPPLRAPNARSTSVASQKRPSPTEQFPQLAIPNQKSYESRRCVWADFLEGPSTREIGAVGCILSSKKEQKANESTTKSTKKKAKWVPLSI